MGQGKEAVPQEWILLRCSQRLPRKGTPELRTRTEGGRRGGDEKPSRQRLPLGRGQKSEAASRHLMVPAHPENLGYLRALTAGHCSVSEPHLLDLTTQVSLQGPGG